MSKTAGSNGCNSCGDVPESEMLVVRDLNMKAPHKGGNQYARICPECGQRTFCSKTYFETTDDPYVIPAGDDEPVPIYDCPYDDCEGTLYGEVDECPDCEQEIIWEE
jgi:hypothetical protein